MQACFLTLYNLAVPCFLTLHNLAVLSTGQLCLTTRILAQQSEQSGLCKGQICSHLCQESSLSAVGHVLAYSPQGHRRTSFRLAETGSLLGTWVHAVL